LLKLIAGLRLPTSGLIKVRGNKISSPYTGLGMVFEEPLLLEWRTTLSNILLQVQARGLRPSDYRKRALELLRSVNLQGWEDSYPRELSAGMRQRVALCRALIHDPPLLLMDEPFGRLDALTREQTMLDLHKLWHKERKTVVFVTHSIFEAVFLSDRVVVLTPRPGRIDQVITIDIPHPRSLDVQNTAEFTAATSQIIQALRRWGLLSE
jgi:NitT/TauT family transport system ATP-binding protein